MRSIANPFDSCRLGDFLIAGLRSDAAGFSGASAFARRSGVAHLKDDIQSFSAGRPFRLVVGIDLHSTSVEALELLLSHGGRKARCYVFHNPLAVFHPKIYRFEYADRWEVYCGSGNLTAGGLFDNYEIGFVARLAKADRQAAAANARLTAEFNRWRNLRSGNARALTPALIRALRKRKLILPEVRIRDVRAAAEAKAGGAGKAGPLFPPSKVPRAPAFAAVPAPPGSARRGASRAAARPQNRLREADARLLVLTIAAGMPGRRATDQDFFAQIPGLYGLTAADRQRSKSKPNQELWHQIVRNVISHRGRTAEDPFRQGLARKIEGGLEVTAKGLKRLRELRLID